MTRGTMSNQESPAVDYSDLLKFPARLRFAFSVDQRYRMQLSEAFWFDLGQMVGEEGASLRPWGGRVHG